MFDSEIDEISNISIKHYYLPADEQADLGLNISDEVLESVLNYKAPAQLGDDIISFNVKLDDALYSLPAPLSELSKDGWIFTEDEKLVIPAKSFGTISVFKGDKKLVVNLDNYSEKAVTVKNYFVTGLKYKGSDKNVKIELSKGIKGDSSIQELLVAFGKPASEDDSGQIHYYSYGEMWKSIDTYRDNEDKYLVSIEITCAPDTLE